MEDLSRERKQTSDDDEEEEEDYESGGIVVEEDEKKKKKKGAGVMSSSVRRVSQPCCQAESCGTDLTFAKRYHRRHKVCELHSKSPDVIVAGLRKRFCQQCSRSSIFTLSTHLSFSLYMYKFYT